MSLSRLLSHALAALALGVAGVNALAAVDINKASADQLQALKGIGPQLSARIMEARQKASFKNWGDLIERVSGLGHAKAARLSAEGLTVAGAAFAATDSMVTAVATARKAAPPVAQTAPAKPISASPTAVSAPKATGSAPTMTARPSSAPASMSVSGMGRATGAVPAAPTGMRPGAATTGR